MLPRSECTAITHLRIKSTGLDTLTAQQRAAGLFAAARLHPISLPSSAILCIRTLRDPLPRAVSLEPGWARPPPAWERAVNAALDSWVGRAARPAQGSVGANAEAVLFADRAELLSCLARDWLRGELRAHWWWASLTPVYDLTAMVFSQWLAAPEHAPAALALLAPRGEAVLFVRRMDVSTTRALLASVARAFALVEIERQLETLVGDSPQTRPTPVVVSPLAQAGQRENQMFPATINPISSRPVSTFRSVVPESAEPELSPLQQIVLGVLLTLTRAPSLLRTQSFAHALYRWHTDSIDGTRASPIQTRAPVLPEPDRLETASPPPTPTVSPAPSREPGAPGSRVLPAATLHNPATSQDLETYAPASQLTTTSASDDTLRIEPRALENHAPPPSPPAPTAVFSESAFAEPILPTGIWTETAFGGLFYLLNLALYLDLYGDFSTPLAPGLELSPWDFLALVGRELAGPEIESDPIWEHLAQLAGRSTDSPAGTGFDVPQEWRAPVAWLKPFSERSGWSWHVRRKRLRVVHPAGFCVLDIPRTNESARTQLLSEIAPYQIPILSLRRLSRVKRGIATKQCSLLPQSPRDNSQSISHPIERWLAWLVPYLVARLQRALGVEGAAAIARFVLAHPARVRTTATHIDIFLSLAGLPLELRFAGLDRDPGWIPPAGRFIAFHFE